MSDDASAIVALCREGDDAFGRVRFVMGQASIDDLPVEHWEGGAIPSTRGLRRSVQTDLIAGEAGWYLLNSRSIVPR